MQNSALWPVIATRKLILITKVEGSPKMAPELFLFFSKASLVYPTSKILFIRTHREPGEAIYQIISKRTL